MVARIQAAARVTAPFPGSKRKEDLRTTAGCCPPECLDRVNPVIAERNGPYGKEDAIREGISWALRRSAKTEDI
jgi:hypothetical protein